MTRGGKKEGNGASRAADTELNPVKEDRKRLKCLAFSKKILSETPVKSSSLTLSPSNTVIKHHGRDILRKSQRKNRYLFSFPGLLAPVSGGKIGELKDLGTKNPVLYLDFPQGQMKLFGTIVYPKNRYLTLKFSRGGKNVMCEDYFDAMIIFLDAWWIGKNDENPEEARLDFPKELNVEQHAEFDFKGGAGATPDRSQALHRPGTKYAESAMSPRTELEDDSSDSENNKELIEVTPTRHSVRMAGKTFNFAEASSEDNSVENDGETLDDKKKNVVEILTRDYSPPKKLYFGLSVIDLGNEDADVQTPISEQLEKPAASVEKSKESYSNSNTLVQATISSLFKKVEEKKPPRKLRNSSSLKVSSLNSQGEGSRQKTDQEDGGPKKKRKVIEERITGTVSIAKRIVSEVEDDIKEFSSSSEDDENDEHWAG